MKKTQSCAELGDPGKMGRGFVFNSIHGRLH